MSFKVDTYASCCEDDLMNGSGGSGGRNGKDGQIEKTNLTFKYNNI
jgi:hypothetical protein